MTTDQINRTTQKKQEYDKENKQDHPKCKHNRRESKQDRIIKQTGPRKN